MRQIEKDGVLYNVDDYGVLYSSDLSVLVTCPDSIEGVYVIPEGVKVIYNCAFKNCTNLTSIIFPESLEDIYDEAFIGCSALRHIHITPNICYLGDFSSAFDGCSNMEEFTVDEENISLKSVDGVLYLYSLHCLLRCPEGKQGKVIMPESCVDILPYAFYNCAKVTSVVLPDALKK